MCEKSLSRGTNIYEKCDAPNNFVDDALSKCIWMYEWCETKFCGTKKMWGTHQLSTHLSATNSGFHKNIQMYFFKNLFSELFWYIRISVILWPRRGIVYRMVLCLSKRMLLLDPMINVSDYLWKTWKNLSILCERMQHIRYIPTGVGVTKTALANFAKTR